MPFSSPCSTSALSTAFDSSSPYAQHMAQTVNGDDPIDMGIDNGLLTHQFMDMSPSKSDYRKIGPSSTMLPQECWNDFDADDLMNIHDDPGIVYDMNFDGMPDPKTAFDLANEPLPWDPSQANALLPSSALENLQLDSQYTQYCPLKSSSMPIPHTLSSRDHYDPITHSEGGMHLNQNPSEVFKHVDSGLSQAYSADVAKSSRSYYTSMMQPTTSNLSSTNPTEYDMSRSPRACDEVSDSADARAGVPLDFMEGMTDTAFERNHFQPRKTVDDLVFGPDKDGSHDFQSINATVHSGEHLSAPDYMGLGMPYYQYSYIQTPIPRISGSLPASRSSSLGFEGNRYKPAAAESQLTITRSSRPEDSFFGIPHQDTPKPRVSSRQAEAPLRQRADSSPHLPPNKAPPVHLGINKHRRRRSTASSAMSDFNRLTAISEGKEAALLAEEGTHVEDESSSQPLERTVSERGRPKRTGPFAEDKRKEIAHRRKERNTCMPCKHHRIQCDGNMPCNKCIGSRNGRACVAADWSGSVKTASCEGPFHRTHSHPTHPGRPPIMQIPASFERATLLENLLSLRSSHNIHVTHVTKSSYEIDLDTCIKLLFHVEQPIFDLQDLFGEDHLGASPADWIKALRGFDQGMTEADRLVNWGIMPCQAIYRLNPLPKVTSPSLNIYQSPETLRSAMALNCIILRALEILAHKAVEKQCKSLLPTSAKAQGPKIVALVQTLGKIACSLRLRIAWTIAYEHLAVDNVETLAAQIDRLKEVAKIIYFWYRIGSKKLQKDVDMNFQGEENQMTINGRHVSDPFPARDSDESISSFDAWLSHGQTVLLDAGLATQLTYSYHAAHQSLGYEQPYPRWDQTSFQY